MITINSPVIKNDNELIWVIEIYGEDATHRFVVAPNIEELVINDVVYKNAVTKGSFEIISNELNLENGGNITSLGSIKFSLSLFREYGINDIDITKLNNRLCKIGFCWVGIQSIGHITYLPDKIISKISYSPATIDFYCYEFHDASPVDLPFYTIQKEFDDGISYFPNAPEENYNACIPILYGDYITDQITNSAYVSKPANLAMAILIDETELIYVVASHPLFAIDTSAGWVHKYIDKLNVWLNVNTTSGNVNYWLAQINLRGEEFTTVTGELYCRLTRLGEAPSPIVSKGAEAFNKDFTDYLTVVTWDVVTGQFNGVASTNETGEVFGIELYGAMRNLNDVFSILNFVVYDPKPDLFIRESFYLIPPETEWGDYKYDFDLSEPIRMEDACRYSYGIAKPFHLVYGVSLDIKLAYVVFKTYFQSFKQTIKPRENMRSVLRESGLR